jgi:hypothetical protein
MNTSTIELGKDFFFGGKSIFTIESHKTGEHKTFKIQKTKPNPRFPTQSFMVSLLTGPCNETNYEYIGIVDELAGNLRLTKASRRNDNSPDVLTFRWFMKHLFTDKVLNNATVHHEGKCGCCGRTLTVPASLKSGVGPECAKRLTA